MTRFLQLLKLIFIGCLLSLSGSAIGQVSAMEHGASARWQWELKRLADPETGNIPLNIRQRELMYISTLPKIRMSILWLWGKAPVGCIEGLILLG